MSKSLEVFQRGSVKSPKSQLELNDKVEWVVPQRGQEHLPSMQRKVAGCIASSLTKEKGK